MVTGILVNLALSIAKELGLVGYLSNKTLLFWKIIKKSFIMESNNKSYRQTWIEANGPIPKGMHIHHILPRYLGGTDELDNLQMVTPEEHYDIHFERGEYGAANLLADGIDRDTITKPVLCYDLDGYFVKRFETTTDADHWLNIYDGKTAVRKCATYTQKSFMGYQWFYESEVGDIDYIGPVKRLRDKGGNVTSKKYTLNLTTMVPYKSMRSCARDYGMPSGCFALNNMPKEIVYITKEEYYYLQELIKL